MNRYLIANWKMNLPPEGIDAYVTALGAAAANDVRIVVAPPFPYLRDISGGPFAIGAQNCADRKSGAFTGEVSPWMLADLGVRYAIIGHSERRQIYGESNELLRRKLAAAIEAGVTPVLCVGEDLRVRESGDAAQHLAQQLEAVVSPALDAAPDVVIAYEPIWAIGTGRNATGAMCGDTVGEIRDALRRFWPSRYADGAPVLYGGSVTPDNCLELEADGNVQGYLVGGASLSSDKFLAIRQGMCATG
jgi:triosephosphate isomerase